MVNMVLNDKFFLKNTQAQLSKPNHSPMCFSLIAPQQDILHPLMHPASP